MNIFQYLTNKFYSMIASSKPHVLNEPLKTIIPGFVELNDLDFIMVDKTGKIVDVGLDAYHLDKYNILIVVESSG